MRFSVRRTVYPCVYREHVMLKCISLVNGGLSLCVQGTSVIWFYRFRGARFIPVCTGNIIEWNGRNYYTPVYPCVYREPRQYTCTNKRVNGLSLCIQGTHSISQIFSYAGRFIPVYTGNPNTDKLVPALNSGLSLCIQGTPKQGDTWDILARFIPVYTGNPPIITYCFIIKILTTKFLPIF